MVPHSMWPLLFLLFHTSLARAALQNFTVDDTFGDPSGFSLFSLEPSSNGGFWTNGPNCTNCDLQPDALLCVDETYHGAAIGNNDIALGYSMTFYGAPFLSSIPFFPSYRGAFRLARREGSAVYVSAIINTVLTTNLTVSLDNGPENQAFTYIGIDANFTDSWEYDVPVFSAKNLEEGVHTVLVLADAPQTGVDVFNWIFIDSVTYS